MRSNMSLRGYENLQEPDLLEPCLVPLKIATAENTHEYGRVVYNFEDEEVWITTWPQTGWRPVCEGTGNEGGITSGRFIAKWNGDLATARSEAVNRDYVIGRLPHEVPRHNRTYVLTRLANYHPDSGRVFYPTYRNPFILVLAPPGDDVKPEDFVAFYFDGSFGFQMKADVWHQGLFSVDNEGTYMTKQGKVHACVLVDTVKEFGKFLKIPLTPELALD